MIQGCGQPTEQEKRDRLAGLMLERSNEYACAIFGPTVKPQKVQEVRAVREAFESGWAAAAKEEETDFVYYILRSPQSIRLHEDFLASESMKHFRKTAK